MANSTTLSAKKRQKSTHTAFALQAPHANSVFVTGSFCGWQPDCFPMKKDKRGHWKAELPIGPGQHEYRFLVDGEWQEDPACTERVPNPFGSHNCVLNVPER
jgi:1,4-alpha-glucan branching enzyme